MTILQFYDSMNAQKVHPPSLCPETAHQGDSMEGLESSMLGFILEKNY